MLEAVTYTDFSSALFKAWFRVIVTVEYWLPLATKMFNPESEQAVPSHLRVWMWAV